MHIVRLAGTVVALALVISPARASSPQMGVEQVAWLAGCWSRTTDTTVVEELWTTPAGGAMFGINRTIRGELTTAHEFLQIRTVDGRLTFIAAPSGQAQAAFALERITDGEVVFANPNHDFPQRITYVRTETGVTARAAATTGDQARVFELALVRCQAADGGSSPAGG